MTETNDPIILVAGQTVVEWGKVEMIWAFIFRDLLFDGFGEEPKQDPKTGHLSLPDDVQPKIDRTDAIFFGLNNSHMQRQIPPRFPSAMASQPLAPAAHPLF